MSFLFCRIFLNLLQFPRTVIWANLLLALVLGTGIFSLKRDFSLLNLFSPQSPTRQQAELFTREYSSLGELVLVSESEEGTRNLQFMQNLALELETWPEVAFVEFRQEIDFFQKHKWLYADLQDLEKVHKALVEVQQVSRDANPLFLDLLESEKKPSSQSQNSLEAIKGKYSLTMNPYLGTEDHKVLFMRVYPTLELMSVEKNQTFFQKVQAEVAKKSSKDIQVNYTGQVYHTLFNQNQLIQETTNSALISLGLVFALLFLFFIRQPFLPFLTLLPIFIAAVLSLGFIGYYAGELNLMVVTLSFLLVGVGSDSIIHLLSRYGEERRKGLGPYIAIENILLETGPAITTANLTSATAFFCMAFFPLHGFKQFGIIAGLSLLFMWLQSLLFFPALLLLLQRKHKFHVWGKKIRNMQQFKARPVHFYKWGLPLVTLLIMMLIPHNPHFERDLAKLSFSPNYADQKLQELNAHRPSPTVFIGSSATQASEIASKIAQIKQAEPEAQIGLILNSKQLLPANQGKKLILLEQISELLDDELIESLPDKLRQMAREFRANSNFFPLGVEDLPASMQKFLKVTKTHFPGLVLVFPKNDMPLTTDQLLRYKNALSKIQIEGEKINPTGVHILLGEYLEKTLPNWAKVFFITFIVAFMLVLFDFKSWQYVLLAVLPVLLSYPIALGFMSLFRAPLNPYNLFLIPFLLGYSIDGTLHIVNRYREEGMGSLPFVLSRTGSAVFVANLTSAMGFLGLAFSSHPTLQSIGILAILALAVSLIASLLILPAFLNILDANRWSKHFRSRN